MKGSIQQQRFQVGSLAIEHPGVTIIDLGQDHPGRAGLLDIQVEVSDQVVKKAILQPGLMHRGAEKLFEVRDYRQILSLANRHDWQAPFFGELLIAQTCEAALGAQIPVRAAAIRTLVAEHTRIMSLLALLAYPVRRLGTPETLGQLAALVQSLRGLLSSLTGNRVHPMFCRLGGVASDLPIDWLFEQNSVLEQTDRVLDQVEKTLDDPHWQRLSANQGVTTKETIAAYGLSGPIARAAGAALDLRLAQPYAAYAQLRQLLIAPAGVTSGDATARFSHFLGEARRSRRMIDVLANGLPGGPVAERFPPVVKLPEGEYHGWVEAPFGLSGVHLVSRGDKTPWRMALRTPSTANVSALEDVLVGNPVRSLELVLASMPWVTGDLDK